MNMDSKTEFNLSLTSYSGPLEKLLDLAKEQKVDLNTISITELADQFLDFINAQKKLNLDIATEYLVMAAWLTYLKSKLLLPEDDDEIFELQKVAEKLKTQLKKLELIRILSSELLKKNQLGKNIFLRGMKGGIKSIHSPVYNVSLYEVLKTYSIIQMQRDFKSLNIPRMAVMTTEEGIKTINENIEKLKTWKNIEELVPKHFIKNKQLSRSGLSAIFAASLELTKQGVTNIMQKELFKKLLIKSANNHE